MHALAAAIRNRFAGCMVSFCLLPRSFFDLLKVLPYEVILAVLPLVITLLCGHQLSKYGTKTKVLVVLSGVLFAAGCLAAQTIFRQRKFRQSFRKIRSDLRNQREG